MKYRTTLVSKAQIVKPSSDEFKALASSIEKRYGFNLKPQMDLLYVRSCLVSAGNSVGVNDNDDIFTREEAWAARHTPVLKPFNWQHDDKDILGVIYTVQARKLDGEVLDISDETPPDCDFDLYVEAAIFRLVHPERSSEIEARAKAGTLFVSMEAWFDDYNYGLCDQQTNQLSKVVTRNKSTSFLDRHLRAGGGVGVYRDPELDQDMRIGRVLKFMTFGGCGFVDRPANKRSVIEAVEPMNTFSGERDTESQIELLLQKVLESQGDETVMNTQNAEQVVSAAVESALDKRAKVAAEKAERDNLIARAGEAEERAKQLQVKIDELSGTKESQTAEVLNLKMQLDQYGQAVDRIVKEAAAGATGSTPAEIAAIDAAKTGEAAFQAKISWLERSVASLNKLASRAAVLEKQLAEAEAVVREQEVRSLLGDSVSEEALEMFVAHAATLNDAEYTRWRDEKELMVLEITTRAAKKDMPVPPKKGEKKEDKSTDKGCANVFEALLAKRRSESGTASPETPTDMGHLINHPGGDGVKSGVTPDVLRTPRHKIAGSTGDNPAKTLENAQEEGSVSLAGAQAGGDGEGVSPFRVLASLVVNAKTEEVKAQERPGFDPVSK